MKSIMIILMTIGGLLSFNNSYCQIKNAKTETVRIYGNCNMCKSKIEKAGNQRKVAKVTWDKDTQMATITYNEKKTNQDEILKRIALVGYDSDKFLAPDDVYEKLDDCCKYDRVAQTASLHSMTVASKSNSNIHMSPNSTDQLAADSPLNAIYENYFALKDALVQTEKSKANKMATNLLATINQVKMEKMAMDEHMVWMKVMKNLESDTKKIVESKDISQQRIHFMGVSKSIYDLMKVSSLESPIYFQHCPMANDGKGADWLSKDKDIKNPYYGNQMLTCGKTVETLK